MKIAVWFSCGAASAVALKETLKRFPREEVIAVNQTIKEEHPDNRRFLRDVEKWLGVKIEKCPSPEYPSQSAKDVWEKRKYMSGVLGAPCTMILKKQARQHWEEENKPNWHVLGFTADEKKRYDKFVITERANVFPVLIDAGITKEDCFDILKEAGIRRPKMYDLGFSNANCIGCVKATGAGYWNLVRKKFPKVFADRAEQSKRLGVKLTRYKNKRIFLEDLPEGYGRKIEEMPECGIFCEEK